MLIHDDEFKEKAVRYFMTHPEMTGRACAKEFDISYSTLSRWYDELYECGVVEEIELEEGLREE